MLVKWFNPSSIISTKNYKTFFIDLIFFRTDEIHKEAKIRLNTSEDEQIIAHALLKSSNIINIMPGIWHISVSQLAENDNKIISTAATKFLVLPIESQEYEINQTAFINLVDKFWSFDNFCIDSSISFGDKNYFSNSFEDIVDNCRKTYWSTSFPDPKSDLGLELDENTSDFENILNLKFRLF